MNVGFGCCRRFLAKMELFFCWKKNLIIIIYWYGMYQFLKMQRAKFQNSRSHPLFLTDSIPKNWCFVNLLLHVPDFGCMYQDSVNEWEKRLNVMSLSSQP